MNVGELVGGAVVVFVVGSQVLGMFRSAKKTSAGVASASALVREALAERAVTGDAPNLREILAAARNAQSGSTARALEAGQTEGLARVLETARQIARQAKEDSARTAGPKHAKQQQRARPDVPAAHGGVRQPLKALGPAAPMHQLHPMAARTPLGPMSPLSPYV